MTATEERINHVAAIELARGKKVERGDEQPEPSRERHRMKVDADRVGIDMQNPLRELVEQERVAEFESTHRLVQRPNLREEKPDDQNRNGNEDSSPRTGRADIEQHAARARHRAHPDE